MNVLLFSVAVAANMVAELPPVTVYASRIDAGIDDIPASVQVIDSGEIGGSLASDMGGLLEKCANVGVRTLNGNPLQAQIFMRGFGENSFGRVKVLLDGEELNGVDMSAPDIARIALSSVERVEVIHGPSPVLHGDGAVAGTINVLTAVPDAPPRTRISAKGGSRGAAGVGFGSRGAVGEEGYWYSSSYAYDRSDGYRDRSAYGIHAFDAAVGRRFENGSRFAVKADYAWGFYEMPGALSYEAWKADRKAAAYGNDWCRTWSAGSGFELKARLAEDHLLYVDGRFSMRRRRSNWGDYGYANDYALYGMAFSPRYANTVPVAGFDNSFTVGSDLRCDRFNVRDRSGLNNPRYHFDRLRTALFLHDEFFFSETFSLAAGVRAEHIGSRWRRHRDLVDPDLDVWTGDFEFGAVWRPAEGVRTYVKATRFHRSPFCDETDYTADGKPLDPETGYSFDVGGSWSFLDEFDLTFNAYGMSMEDEIFFNPYVTPGVYGWNGYNCNSPSETRRAGFDVSFGWLRRRTAEASVRYGAVHADFDGGKYDGETVPLVPAHRVRAEAGVWIVDDLEVKAGCRYVSPQYLMGDFENAHDRLKGFIVFDAGIVYTPCWAEGWKAVLVVDNLFDKDYCDLAGWSDWSGFYCYPACGRSLLATVEYEF